MAEEDTQNKAKPLDEADINLMMRYGRGPYAKKITELEA